MSHQLPELPLPSAFGIGNTRYFSVDQMRAYAELVIACLKLKPLSNQQINDAYERAHRAAIAQNSAVSGLELDRAFAREIESAHGITTTTASKGDSDG